MKLAIYSIEHDRTETDFRDIQQSLLFKWWAALNDKKCPVIDNAKISFKMYKFSDYYDQKQLKAIIKNEYANKAGDLYWCGTKYETVDDLYNELKEQKLFAELIIEEVS